MAEQLMISEQDKISVTSQSSVASHSSEESIVSVQESDTYVKLSADIKNVEDGKLCNEIKPEKGIHLVPDKELTDISATPMSLLPKESGVRQPTEKIIERKTLEESLSHIPMDTFQKVCSTDNGSASTASREDRVLNTFLTNNSDKFQPDIDDETTTEFESISYPPAFDMHVSGMGDKPYGCKYCTRRFSHRSSLYRHQKSHTGEKLYKCSECNKSFTNSSNLNVHSRIHTGEKPYECNGCGKKFTRKFALDQHLKIHRQEKLYICSHCGKSYSDYFFLLKHQQMEKSSATRIPDSIMK
ncbi:zinc finger protein 37-like isoform X2 [Pseudophryne corroboree]|uniref:zinc finger protein 37-like isoform X2 n=1 Tax=Pseudophryne corroboree TaxID=495146 RepID=UPI0030814530